MAGPGPSRFPRAHLRAPGVGVALWATTEKKKTKSLIPAQSGYPTGASEYNKMVITDSLSPGVICPP